MVINFIWHRYFQQFGLEARLLHSDSINLGLLSQETISQKDFQRKLKAQSRDTDFSEVDLTDDEKVNSSIYK